MYDEDGIGAGVPALFAGGAFVMAGSTPVKCIARWDGQNWSAVGGGITSGVTPAVFAMTTFDADEAGPLPTELIVSGTFSGVGGNFIINVAKWNGSVWSAIATSGLLSGVVRALAVVDLDASGPQEPTLFGGGESTSPNPGRLTESGWQPLGVGPNAGVAGTVYAMTGYDHDGPGPNMPRLIVAGSITSAGGAPAARIAAWNGTWSTLGVGIGAGSSVYALAVFDPDGPGPAAALLIAGGQFTSAGGNQAGGIAAWNGSVWSPLGEGVAPPLVRALASADLDGGQPGLPALFVGGEFITAGTTSAEGVARWDGSAWSALGLGTSGPVYSLAPYDSDGPSRSAPGLMVGGFFDNAGGAPSHRIAYWRCPTCYPDCNADGSLTIADFACFQAAFVSINPHADCDHNGGLTIADFPCFQSSFVQGCP